MKKIFASFLAVMFLLTAPICAFGAQTDVYELPELGLSIAIPSQYEVLTRDTSVNDPVFAYYGLSGAEMMEHFQNNDIYLDAFTENISEEIVVTMIPGVLWDYSQLSDAMLEVLADTMKEQLVEYGIEVTDWEIYQHTQAKFLKFYFTDAANAEYGVQYSTYYAGQALNFTMHSWVGKVTPAQERTIKTVVDSIHFNTDPELPEPAADTKPFVHTDPDTGMTFTVPANWKQVPLTANRDVLDAAFRSIKNEGISIYYGSVDMWSTLTPIERIGYTRESLDTDAAFQGMSADEIVAAFELTDQVKVESAEMVTYNGHKYVQMHSKCKVEKYGVTVNVSMLQLVCIEQGWCYTFQFTGSQDNALMKDFKALLNSVEYPEVAQAPDVTKPPVTLPQKQEEQEPQINPNIAGMEAGIAAVIILVVAAIGVGIFLYLKKRKNDREEFEGFLQEVKSENAKPSPAAAPVQTNTPTPVIAPALEPAPAQAGDPVKAVEPSPVPTFGKTGQPLTARVKVSQTSRKSSPENEKGSTPAAQVQYCRKCGEPLPLDSVFCHICGTKIWHPDSTSNS